MKIEDSKQSTQYGSKDKSRDLYYTQFFKARIFIGCEFEVRTSERKEVPPGWVARSAN
jgi:hypothetical protein